jgi:hypothetical protein
MVLDYCVHEYRVLYSLALVKGCAVKYPWCVAVLVRCERTDRFSLRNRLFIASTSHVALRCGTLDQPLGAGPHTIDSMGRWSSSQSTKRRDEAMTRAATGSRGVASPVLSPSLLRTHAGRACDPARAIRCAMRSEEQLQLCDPLVWSRGPYMGPSLLAGRSVRLTALLSTAREVRPSDRSPSARASSGPRGA